MIIAYILFGEEANITFVSKDELFIIFCVFQSRLVNDATFMLANLDRIAHATHKSILIEGIVTMIVAAIGLRTPVSHLTPLGGIRPMNIVFCFNHRLTRNLGSNAYELLIRNEVVHHFTFPNHERTNVENQDNWLYDLEGQSESPTLPETPLSHEYHPTPLSDTPSHVYVACAIPPVNHARALNVLRADVATLRDDVATIHLYFHSFMDVTHEQFDHIY